MESRAAEILNSAHKIHFVGIGGSGMFPLVEILNAGGRYEITGSDVNEGIILDLVRGLGIPVSIGHDAKNAEGADALVVTAALLEGNAEVGYAEQHNIPIIKRAELLGWATEHLGRAYCIGGTHGKTTATSMLTSIFVKAGVDLSAVIGGKLPLIGGYGRYGKSGVMVAEACEFKDTYLHMSPAYAVILNVDADHLDYFGSLDGVKASFKKFANLAKTAVIANGDDKNTLDTLEGVTTKVILFGKGANCDYKISDITKGGRAFYSFTLTAPSGKSGQFTLSVPGEHNVYNAAAAATCALIEGLSFEEIQPGFDSFRGAGRRFEILGEYGGITFADDYAHHPAEIRVTLAAAAAMGYNRIIAVFQPFTFTRTKLLLNDFASALSSADKVVLTEIMGSREVNTVGITTQDLCELIEGACWFKTFSEVCDHCLAEAKPGDLIITLGCGDIYKAANEMVKRCKILNQ